MKLKITFIILINLIMVQTNGKGLFDDENKILDSIGNSLLPTLTTQNKLLLYPNPASSAITIEYLIVENALLTIYDITGRAIIQTELNKTNSKTIIDIDKYANGLYTYKLVSEGLLLNTGKFIKE